MPLEEVNPVRTVSQLTADIKLLLESTCRFVAVSGEISNLKIPFSGHHYFTLKDGTAQLRAVLFKGQQRYLVEKIRDGQQVICRGRISVYEPRGEYQLIVDTIDQYGVGVLQMKFAALKNQLAEEGLFDQSRKKQLPSFPEKIVVISSPTGAAIQDFLKICRQRGSTVNIQIFPVPVQGALAAPAITRAIAKINTTIPCDLIVLCRGGGSIEDLWAFNEESVARAIADSAIPVVTGIGHETDTTIADLCADRRAPTPTGAAELIIPDAGRLRLQVHTAAARLRRTIRLQLDFLERTLQQQGRHLLQYRGRVENLSLRLDPVIMRFNQAAQFSLQRRQEHLDRLTVRLKHQAPRLRIVYQRQTVRHLQQELNRLMYTILKTQEERLARAAAVLHGVSPLSTLARGYAIVQAVDTATRDLVTVSRSSQVAKGDRLQVLLHEGKLACKVLEME